MKNNFFGKMMNLVKEAEGMLQDLCVKYGDNFALYCNENYSHCFTISEDDSITYKDSYYEFLQVIDGIEDEYLKAQVTSDLNRELEALVKENDDWTANCKELMKKVFQAFKKKYGTNSIFFDAEAGNAPYAVYNTPASATCGYLKSVTFNNHGRITTYTFLPYYGDELTGTDVSSVTFKVTELIRYAIGQVKGGCFVS